MSVWVLLTAITAVTCAQGKICTSVDIRNRPDHLELLRGCHVVEGSVQIVLMEWGNETDFDLHSFPELREITEYLMLYRVDRLRNIGQIFPNLTVIRGESLFQDYALVVFEMSNLQEIGLRSLAEITRGAVRIEKNPRLCYVDTVGWDQVARWDPLKNYITQNKPADTCPRCNPSCPQGLCWSLNQCQIQNDTNLKSNCHPLCMGGCMDPGPKGCYTCRKFLTVDNVCVEHCPLGTYQYLNRRCITEEECFKANRPQQNEFKSEEKRFVIFNGTCTDHCPAGYQLDDGASSCIPCQGKCNKMCQGGNIDNIEAAQKLRGCTLIKGSLEINIRSGKPKIIAQELEENLGDIQEITGVLKIVRSSPIVNLHFLKSLVTIRGDSIDNYAMLVLSNQNLQELWDWETKPNFKILKNRLFFHYNPKLCMHHIQKLVEIVHQQNFTDDEVSKESNGDKIPCNASTIHLSVTHRSSNTIQIHIPSVDLHSEHSFLRYVIYYIKDPGKNISKFDDLDQCSDYGWMSNDMSIDNTNKNKPLFVNLTMLEPYTQYSFYVTAYTLDQIVATSEILTETTIASKPSELLSVNVNAASSQIFVSWEPPRHVNGKLEEFIVTWSPLERDNSFLKLRDYCTYPLSYDPDLRDLKYEVNKVVRNETSCCDKEIREIPKDGYEKLCSNIRYHTAPSGFHELVSGLSCESYFNIYLQNTKVTTEYGIAKNESEISISMKLKEVSEIQYLNDRLNKNKKSISNKEEVKTNTVHLPAGANNFTIKGVKYFHDFIVTIEACREKEKIADGMTDTHRCSKRDIVVVRTWPDKDADVITKGIYHDVVNRTLYITWESPLEPNGIIVAFELEYRQKDVTNSKLIKYCIPYSEYKLNKNSYSIVDVVPGRYEFRVRAISLAGRGPFIQFRGFTVPRPFTVPGYALVLVLIICIVVIMLLLTLALKFSKIKKPNLDGTLFASVNPEYACVLDHWEVPKEDIVLVKEIGSGTFGKVYEGVLQPNSKPCAVKTVNENTFAYDKKVFLNEASVMKSVSGAYHIVQLMGVVSREKPPLVIMELMNVGDLRSFLISSRSTDPPDDTTKLKMAAQIADGMCFMESKKFVHRDLAARNCLVNKESDSRYVVKIGDFGMTRDIYETDYYRKGDKGLLPIRWMAPESLKDGLFTSQSDVWSYGIVLWEIVTMGEQPYQGSSNEAVLREVMAGRLRLQIPIYCPSPLKTIMLACWRSKPSQRVNFMKVVGSLECFIDEEFKKVSYYHSQEAINSRKALSDYVEMWSIEDPLLSEDKMCVINGGLPRNGGISMLLARSTHRRYSFELNPVQEDLDSCGDL